MDPRDTRADFPRLALETVSRIDTRGKVKVEDKPGLCGIESSPSRWWYTGAIVPASIIDGWMKEPIDGLIHVQAERCK